jgi:CubicO group peptidase (beta-lactamase class C family)
MYHFRLSLLVIFFFTVSLRASELSIPSITKLMNEARETWEVPGVYVVIVTKDKILYTQGCGTQTLGKNIPITEKTLFPIASCSKAFITTLIGQLVDEEKMHWDDRVQKHLKNFRLSDKNANELVSIRDLLCHRTGVASHDLIWYRAKWKMPEMIERAGKLPLSRPFRQDLQYQTVLFSAAGLAAAEVTGEPWPELLKRKLLSPLELNDTFTHPDLAPKENRCSGHMLNEKDELIPTDWYIAPDLDPACSLHSSPRDIAKWLQFFLNQGEYQGKRLISEQSLAEIFTPQIVIRPEGVTRDLAPESNLLSYGLGWVIQDYRGKLIYAHAGLIDGFRVQFTLLPKEGYGIAVFANKHDTRLPLALSCTLTDHLLKLEPKKWNSYYIELIERAELEQKIQRRRLEQRRQGIKPTFDLSEYVGKYANPAYGIGTIKLMKDHLYWEWGNFGGELKHWEGDIFELQHPDRRVNGSLLGFQIEKGKILSVRWGDTGIFQKE